MSIVLTRTKEEHLNVWWEPFATSTPLKPRPKAKITSVPQNQPLIHNDSPDFADEIRKNCRVADVFRKESKPLASKKTRKKKSLIYFDSTSSSDEDSSDGAKRRPIIKLRSGKKTKSILVNNNLSDEKSSTNKEINNVKKLENMSFKNCETEPVISVRNMKIENVQSHVIKNKIINDGLKLDSNSKDTSLSSDDGSKIFDETRKVKNITKDSTLHLVNKENKISNSKSSENLKYLKVPNDKEKTVLKETCLINPVFKKSTQKNSDQDSESLSVPKKRTCEYNKSCKSQKRKCNKDNEIRSNNIKRTKNKKINDKLVSHIPVENSRSPLHIWDKNNLSHQLFSDSKEQELINVLDLTEGLDEKVKNMDSSLIQKKGKLSYKSTNSSHPSVINDLDLNECRQNQPKRKKQNLKKCLMQESLSNELVQNVNTKSKIKSKKNSNDKLKNNDQIPEFQIQKKSEELDLLSDVVNPVNSVKSDRKCLRSQKNSKKITTNAPEKGKTSFAVNDFLNNSNSDNKLRSSEENNVNLCTSTVPNTDNNKIADSNNPLIQERSEKAVGRKKPVFKLLNKLSYKENEMGCSVAEGWRVNNFKCGIFKLKVNAQMSCKTLHSNSNLGGVLIKGNLRMKIGNRELNLTEGDMAYVPPLTEWLATNIGKCETLFYYWCGRFDV